jgi:hypothetical protein
LSSPLGPPPKGEKAKTSNFKKIQVSPFGGGLQREEKHAKKPFAIENKKFQSFAYLCSHKLIG